MCIRDRPCSSTKPKEIERGREGEREEKEEDEEEKERKKIQSIREIRDTIKEGQRRGIQTKNLENFC